MAGKTKGIRLQQATIMLYPKTRKDCEKLAKELGVSFSEIVRRAMENGLSEVKRMIDV